MRENARANDSVIDTPRFRWRVRDCVFCSWRELREEYSAVEIWQLLIQGRFAKAARLPSSSHFPVTSLPLDKFTD